MVVFSTALESVALSNSVSRVGSSTTSTSVTILVLEGGFRTSGPSMLPMTRTGEGLSGMGFGTNRFDFGFASSMVTFANTAKVCAVFLVVGPLSNRKVLPSVR